MKKTRTLVLTAILIAITLILGLTPIGFIRVVPGFIEITLMCIPVIAGALVLGVRPGMMLGLIFAITSIIQALIGSPLGQMLLEESVPKTLVLLIVPRILVPVSAHLVYNALKAKNDILSIGLASCVGSLVNTVLFLLMLATMFQGVIASEVFTVAAFANGSVEAVVAVVVCTPVVRALKKSVPPISSKGETVAQ